MMSSVRRERLSTFFLLLPGIGFIAIFVALVMGLTLVQSLGLINPTGRSRLTIAFWAGLFDRQLFDSLAYSTYVGLASAFGSMLLCYPLALLLFRPFPGKNLILPLIRVPLFVPALVATFLILNIMDYHGFLNYVLLKIGAVREPLRMRNDPYAIGVVLIQLWKNIPFQLVIMTAALEGIREDLREAARNLGAGPLRLFRRIILPLTIPSALISIILVFIGAFGDFAITKTAGPLYPMSLSVLMHTRAYQFQEWNAAACVGTMMVVVTIAFVAAYTRLASRVQDG